MSSTSTSTTAPAGFLRFAQVIPMVGLSRSHLHRLIAAGTFPAPVPIGPGSVGFVAEEIHAWMAERTSPEARAEGARRRREMAEARRRGRVAP